MPIIKVEGLKKYYGKEPNIVRALDGIDLEIESGKFVAIVGMSGSGKSDPISRVISSMGGDT